MSALDQPAVASMEDKGTWYLKAALVAADRVLWGVNIERSMPACDMVDFIHWDTVSLEMGPCGRMEAINSLVVLPLSGLDLITKSWKVLTTQMAGLCE